MPHQFDPQLVFPEREVGDVCPHRHEMIELICPAHVRKAQHALFRDRHIQLKLAELEIQPGRVRNVVEAHVGGFKPHRSASRIDRRHQQKRNILGQRAAGQNIDAGEIKTEVLMVFSIGALAGSPGTEFTATSPRFHSANGE